MVVVVNGLKFCVREVVEVVVVVLMVGVNCGTQEIVI